MNAAFIFYKVLMQKIREGRKHWRNFTERLTEKLLSVFRKKLHKIEQGRRTAVNYRA